MRALWADVDDALPEAALERCRKAGLPEPTLAICSGRGSHLYWRLDEPYLIEDVGPPPKVEKEFIKKDDGKKTCRNYVIPDGEKLYLDERPDLKRLSPKAHHVQNVLAGIAKAIGGDNTYDLARLLRVPGTLNRKDQRNGTPPKPTWVHVREPSRRYPFSEFEKFATPTKEAEREQRVATMPLPERRKLNAKTRDSLAEQLAMCRITDKGNRSETEFGVCCYAVRKGIGKEEFWSAASGIGKFAEAGQAYFDRTWGAAERAAREETYDRLTKKRKSPAGTNRIPTESTESVGRPLVNVSSDFELAIALRSISDVLVATGSCYSRAGQLVEVRGNEIRSILSAPELSGLISQYAECVDGSGESISYAPLSTAYANAWLHNAFERERFPEIKLFTRNPVYTLDWRLSEPGYDPQSGIYYAGPRIVPREEPTHLVRLLKDFCWRHPGDRTNYVAMLLTMILMPRFVGSKPAVLFNGNQSGVGKTVLSQIIARLRDGRSARTVTYNPNDEEMEKRLGSVVHSGATTVIVDNAKTRRGQSLSSPCFERCITDEILSFRLLTRSLDIAVENSLIFGITANSPDVCADILSRCCIVNLYYEGSPRKRDFDIQDPESYAIDNRTELLGELAAMVEAWRAAGSRLAAVSTRFNKKGWGPIVGGILEHSGFRSFMANAEDAQEELDDTRREFGALIEALVDSPEAAWTSTDLAVVAERERLLRDQLGEGNARSKATKLGLLASAYDRTTFTLSDGKRATLQKRSDGKRTQFVVDVEDGSDAEGF